MGVCGQTFWARTELATYLFCGGSASSESAVASVGPLSHQRPIAPNHPTPKLGVVKFIRRYWIIGLILVMVGVHAAIIGYVRNQLAMLETAQVTAVTVGSFRFRTLQDPSHIHSFQLHAVLEPTQHFRAVERIEQLRLEIHESSEQLLRQVDPSWLADPNQKELRGRLLEIVLRHLNEPLVQRVLITDWLSLPVQPVTATNQTFATTTAQL